ARGGGTSQAGQSIGPGVILDTSKHLNRVLEIDAAGRRAPVQPGCVLHDPNPPPRPLGLQFAPPNSPAHPAPVGRTVAHNRAGAPWVISGKPIDHVLELKAGLADGSFIRCRRLEGPELEAASAREDLEGACYRAVRRLAAELAEEIDRRYPKILRRVGGYNLDSFRHDGAGFYLAHMFFGSEGALRGVVGAPLRLGERPQGPGPRAASSSPSCSTPWGPPPRSWPTGRRQSR